MTTHEPDDYCEDCGQPVLDGINGDVDREHSIAVCAACMEDGWLQDLEEIHADLDAMNWQQAQGDESYRTMRDMAETENWEAA